MNLYRLVHKIFSLVYLCISLPRRIEVIILLKLIQLIQNILQVQISSLEITPMPHLTQGIFGFDPLHPKEVQVTSCLVYCVIKQSLILKSCRVIRDTQTDRKRYLQHQYITINYRQTQHPQQRISIVVSNTVEVSMNKIAFVNSYRCR